MTATRIATTSDAQRGPVGLPAQAAQRHEQRDERQRREYGAGEEGIADWVEVLRVGSEDEHETSSRGIYRAGSYPLRLTGTPLPGGSPLIWCKRVQETARSARLTGCVSDGGR